MVQRRETRAVSWDPAGANFVAQPRTRRTGKLVSVISITELYKYYDDRRAVGPLSVEMEQGHVVGLLGLNGAGKTTTLRIMACDLLPTSGTVTVGGLDVVERPDEVRARVGYLPDTPPLYPEMSVREFLSYAARLRGVAATDANKRVDEAIELTELGDEQNRLIEALSHGFKQRVGIAQAIVHKPEFVVLDEPISGLDPAQIVEMRRLVRSLSGDHTVVLSSHNLHEISETCDRLVVINHGRIVAHGTEQELTASQAGMRVEVTVKGSETSSLVAAKAKGLLEGLSPVKAVESLTPTEVGDGIASLAVRSESDARQEICRALVEAGLGVLELARTEKELENAFLQLFVDEKERRRAKASAAAAASASARDDGKSETREPAADDEDEADEADSDGDANDEEAKS